MDVRCSVVVPTYNRLSYLKKCLASLSQQDFEDFEIIVVDDASTDGTWEFLDNLNNPLIRPVHHQTNGGVAMARNSGIAAARGQTIAFIDDDCEAQAGWLTELLKGFADPNAGFVIGETFYVAPHYHGYFPERLVKNENAKWPMTCNIAYKKSVFEKCGSFDARFLLYNNEDSEMAIRALSQGFSFMRQPSAQVKHQAMLWRPAALLRSARNASVWPVLKKLYPNHYRIFGPPVMGGWLVNGSDYLWIVLLPLTIPILLIRYLVHGQRDLKIFFIKWPVWLILRRWFIYKEAWHNKVFMI